MKTVLLILFVCASLALPALAAPQSAGGGRGRYVKLTSLMSGDLTDGTFAMDPTSPRYVYLKYEFAPDLPRGPGHEYFCPEKEMAAGKRNPSLSLPHENLPFNQMVKVNLEEYPMSTGDDFLFVAVMRKVGCNTRIKLYDSNGDQVEAVDEPMVYATGEDRWWGHTDLIWGDVSSFKVHVRLIPSERQQQAQIE